MQGACTAVLLNTVRVHHTNLLRFDRTKMKKKKTAIDNAGHS